MRRTCSTTSGSPMPDICPVCSKPVALYRHKSGVHPKCQPKITGMTLPPGRHNVNLGIAAMSQKQRDVILRRIAKAKE